MAYNPRIFAWTFPGSLVGMPIAEIDRLRRFRFSSMVPRTTGLDCFERQSMSSMPPKTQEKAAFAPLSAKARKHSVFRTVVGHQNGLMIAVWQ